MASSAAVRAVRLYRPSMALVVWPVRSITHVSLFPVASLMVANVARRSWARMGSRAADFSNSCGRSTPAFSKSARNSCAKRWLLIGPPSARRNTRPFGVGSGCVVLYFRIAAATPGSSFHARGLSVLFSSSETTSRTRSRSDHSRSTASPSRMASRARKPQKSLRLIGTSDARTRVEPPRRGKATASPCPCPASGASLWGAGCVLAS